LLDAQKSFIDNVGNKDAAKEPNSSDIKSNSDSVSKTETNVDPKSE
jgi:hypothetical protein